jgi:hypothetical protein
VPTTPAAAPTTRAPAPAPARSPSAELDRQVETLLRCGLPAAAGLDEDAFARLLLPLRDALPEQTDGDAVPFVVVLPRTLAPAAALVERLVLRGRPGFTSMAADELARFTPTGDVEVPDGPYLAVGLDTGADTLGVPPVEALPRLLADGRSPLTLEEGLALVLHHPEVLTERNCFEMLGSRCGDKRVTGLWVMKGGRPRLGWCWQGAPHDWLGMATCAQRRA